MSDNAPTMTPRRRIHLRLSPSQFEQLATLLRVRPTTREAARLVLVEGRLRREVMELTHLSAQSLSNTLARFRDAHEGIVANYVASEQGHYGPSASPAGKEDAA
jgi:hypothetical protein